MMSAATALRVEPFGTPRLRIDGTPIRLGSRKALGLVLVLALDGAQTREALCTLLWPDADVPGARRNLRRDLFRLRSAGVPLTENGDGALALACSAEFDRDGTAGPALKGLGGLAGTEFEAWLANARAKLETERSRRLRERAQAHWNRGDASAALDAWRRALSLDPCDEAAAHECISALLSQGERAAAAAMYERTRRALAEQLGLPPSASLRAVRDALQVTEPSHVPPPTAANGARAASGASSTLAALVPFIDRPALRARIEAAWDAGRRVYLTGPPGIGKSRLARECARAHGAWLQVSCSPNDALLPNGWAVRALRLLREASPDVVLQPWIRRELAQLMPELGRAPAPLATDEARSRLVAALAAAFAALVKGNFQVLVLDDWQWTDNASLDLWDALRTATGDLRWLVTFRSGELPRAALERMRSEIDAGQAERIVVPGLDDDETLRFVRTLTGRDQGAMLSARLRAVTDGNPFFLLETLRQLESDGALRRDLGGGFSTCDDERAADRAELAIPRTVREALLARARALGEPVLRLLQAASLLGPPFDVPVLADTTQLDQDSVLVALSHAAAAQLVAEEEHDGFGFTHDVVRQCLMEGLGASRRRALHGRLAEALQHHGAAPALIATHFEAAGHGSAALRWRCDAARAAMLVHALPEALTHWQHALLDGAAGAQAAEIHLECAELHRRIGDRDAAEEALQRATAAAREHPDLALTAQVARVELWVNDRGDVAVQWLDALAPDLACAPPALQSRALAARARALNAQDRIGEAAGLLRQAIARLHNAPDTRVDMARLLNSLASNSMRRGDLADALQHIQKALTVLDTVDADADRANALALQGALLLNLSRRLEAEAVLEQARTLAASIGHVPLQRASLLNLVKIATDTGDLERAVALIDEGEALAPSFEHARVHAGFCEARFYVDYLRGDALAARASAERLLHVVDTLSGRTERIGSRTMVVDFFLLEGDLTRAAELLEQAQRLCEDVAGAGGSGLHHAACSLKKAWLMLERGEPAQAAALLDAMGTPEREQDRVDRAWLGAAAALTLGVSARAEAWLASGPPSDGVPADIAALWYAQALRAASAKGVRDPSLESHARSLLRGTHVPAAVADRLRKALDRVAEPGLQR